MDYFAGLDGGATKTKCVITDKELNIISESVGPASNFLIRGLEPVANDLVELLNSTIAKAKLTQEDISAVCIGSTGAGRKKNAVSLKDAIIDVVSKKGLPFENCLVMSDASIALEGAFSGNAGCILIAGTGSILFGKDENDNEFRVGGFGRTLGDEGSGYSLGKAGLNAVAKFWDGRGKETAIASLLSQKFNINDQNSLIDEVYSNNFDIPSVAPLVIEAAENGDIKAQEIIDKEVSELLLHIKPALGKIKTRPLKLALIGSLIDKENYYSQKFRSKLKEKFPEVEITSPKYPPEIGAVLKAIKSSKSGIR